MGVAASQVAFEQIALWILDLTGAYRVLAVKRREWGQQSYVWADGIRLDLCCLFGTASMVEFFERVTFLVLSVAQRRIAEYDRQHPYSPARQAWSEWRAQHAAAPADPLAASDPGACTASYIYLDDGFDMVPVRALSLTHLASKLAHASRSTWPGSALSRSRPTRAWT